jgi:hypothetical protein
VYWTGPVASPEGIDGQDHPAHRGSPSGYEVDSGWLTRYWFQIAVQRRAIRAQLHTHSGAAFHSATDDHWPAVFQEGFISIVIPNFAMGAVSMEGAWVGVLGRDRRWQSVMAEAVIELTS